MSPDDWSTPASLGLIVPPSPVRRTPRVATSPAVVRVPHDRHTSQLEYPRQLTVSPWRRQWVGLEPERTTSMAPSPPRPPPRFYHLPPPFITMNAAAAAVAMPSDEDLDEFDKGLFRDAVGGIMGDDGTIAPGTAITSTKGIKRTASGNRILSMDRAQNGNIAAAAIPHLEEGELAPPWLDAKDVAAVEEPPMLPPTSPLRDEYTAGWGPGGSVSVSGNTGAACQVGGDIQQQQQQQQQQMFLAQQQAQFAQQQMMLQMAMGINPLAMGPMNMTMGMIDPMAMMNYQNGGGGGDGISHPHMGGMSHHPASHHLGVGGNYGHPHTHMPGMVHQHQQQQGPPGAAGPGSGYGPPPGMMGRGSGSGGPGGRMAPGSNYNKPPGPPGCGPGWQGGPGLGGGYRDRDRDIRMGPRGGGHGGGRGPPLRGNRDRDERDRMRDDNPRGRDDRGRDDRARDRDRDRGGNRGRDDRGRDEYRWRDDRGRGYRGRDDRGRDDWRDERGGRDRDRGDYRKEDRGRDDRAKDHDGRH